MNLGKIRETTVAKNSTENIDNNLEERKFKNGVTYKKLLNCGETGIFIGPDELSIQQAINEVQKEEIEKLKSQVNRLAEVLEKCRKYIHQFHKNMEDFYLQIKDE